MTLAALLIVLDALTRRAACFSRAALIFIRRSVSRDWSGGESCLLYQLGSAGLGPVPVRGVPESRDDSESHEPGCPSPSLDIGRYVSDPRDHGELRGVLHKQTHLAMIARGHSAPALPSPPGRPPSSPARRQAMASSRPRLAAILTGSRAVRVTASVQSASLGIHPTLTNMEQYRGSASVMDGGIGVAWRGVAALYVCLNRTWSTRYQGPRGIPSSATARKYYGKCPLFFAGDVRSNQVCLRSELTLDMFWLP